MRTQEEIVARINAPRPTDMFGFSNDVLLGSLEFEHAKPFLTPETTAEQWTGLLLTDGAVEKAALEYLTFAWGKAEDHRGLSAQRSIVKMTEFCWLLGHDVKSIEEAGYAQYGAPKLKVVARLLGVAPPTSHALVRMMNGQPCHDFCEDGCGQ